MANLIQSKQIEGIVTASVVSGEFVVSGSSDFTGSLNVSGSVSASGDVTALSFYGDGSTLSNVETTGRGIISGSEQLPAGIISGSEQLPSGILSSSEQLPAGILSGSEQLPDGIISSSTQITSFGFISGSDLDALNAYTESTDIRLTDIESTTSSLQSRISQLESDTGSQDSRLDSLESATSSYETVGSGIFSGSEQLPAGLFSGSEQLPDGIVSSSAQITSLGFISASDSTTSLNEYTESTDNRLTSIEAATSSYESIGSGIVSGSEQITSLGFISSSDSTVSLNEYTESTDNRLSNIESATSSYETVGSGIFSGSEQLPDGIVSSSAQITSLGFISSSEENTSLNEYTESNDARLSNIEAATSSYETVGSGIFSGSEQLPAGLVSGSEQVDYDDLLNKPAFIGGTNVTITSASNGITINSTGGGGGSTDISHLNAYTASNDINITNIHSTTSSIEDRLSNIESNTGSYDESADIQHLNDYTHSSDQRLDGLSEYTESTDTRLDGFNTYTSSTDQRLERIEISTASFEQHGSGILSSSAQITALGFVSESSGASVGHLNNFTSSANIRLANLESTTSSLSESLDQRVGSLEVYSSSNDTRMLGVDTTTASFESRFTSIESETASFESRFVTIEAETASIDARLDDIQSFTASNGISSLNDYTSSTAIRLDNLESETSSIDSRFDTIESYTSSNDTRLLDIESTTSSFEDRFTTIEAETSSINTRLDDIEAATSSYETIGSGIVSGSDQLTSSYDDRYESRATGTKTLLSSSVQVNYEELSNLPANIISSSEQFPSGVVSGSIQVLGGTDIISGSQQLEDLGFRSGSLQTGEVSSIELETSGSGSYVRKALTDSYQPLEFITTPIFETGSSNWTIGDGSSVKIGTSGTYVLNTNFTLYKADDNDRLALFKWQRSSDNTNWSDVSGSTFGISSPSMEPDYSYGGGVSTTFIESGSYVRVVGRLDASTDEPISVHNSDSEGGRSTVSIFLVNGTNAGGGGGSTDLGSLSSAVIDVTADSIGFIDASDSNASRKESIVDLVNAIAGDNITPNNGQLNATTPSGTVSSSAQITALGFVSESGDSTPDGTISGSQQILDFGIFATTGSNTFTGSQFFSGSLIPEALSSENGIHDLGSLSKPWRDLYITTGSLNFVKDGQLVSSVNGEPDAIRIGNILITTSSLQIVSGSGDALTTVTTIAEATVSSSGEVTETNQLLAPNGTVSSSAQITAFGFVSESGTNASVNAYTSSTDARLDDIEAATSSFETTGRDIVSSSAQITALGFVSESSADLTSLNAFTASNENTSLNSYTSSLNAGVRLNNLENTTSSFEDRFTSIESETSSIDSRLDTIEAATGSYLTSSGSVDYSDITSLPTLFSSSEQLPSGIISSSEQLPDGTVSGSSQLTSSYDARYQLSGSSIPFDGNRVVSQEKLPTMFTSSFNPGTSGSVVDFLNAIFYPNTEPTITSVNQTIGEYSASGASIFTLEATDPEGQSITFGTASSYTDDLVRVASDGVVTLNALAESSSFNTDLVGGVHGHTFVATATDTFNSTVSKNITIFVTPNAAPIFRETSVGGNQINSVTASLNENSSDGTLVKRIFFTDAEGDTITIDSSSILPAGGASHFTITKYSTYVDIEQNTGSLDFETYPTYTFSLTASDEHYQNSQDTDSFTVLPVSISVTDNVHPTINNQTLSTINENSNDGDVVGSISATDPESDVITFSQFTLYKLELDNVDVPSGSYGGTSQATDPHENPFQMNSSGQVTRKTGVFLNSDLINEYQYTVRVRDSFNTASNEAIVTIPISDDTAATLSDNWAAGPYIIESAVSGALIRTNSNGFSGTQADYGSNQSGTFTSSNPAIAINGSNGQLSLALDLSGSTTQSTDTITSTITFTNSFGTTTTDNLTVNVTENSAPDIIFVSSSILNTNQASASSEELVSIRFSDVEGDSIDTDSFTFTEPTGQLTASLSGSSFKVFASSSLSGSTTYEFTASIEDEHHFRTNTESQTITIAQADTGSISTNGTFYIIESAVSGALIRTNSNGRTGTQGDLGVTYSPNYGSQTVQSFTSENPAIAVTDAGNLSLNLDLSGSSTSSGDTITSEITFDDQYGNTGTGTITINVAANQAPEATFTDQSANFNTDSALSGSTMVSMSISDDESDTPFSASISGSDLELVFSSADSSSVGIHATSNLTARTHTYSITVFDQFGKSRSYNDRTFTVAQSADYGITYLYRSDYGTDAGLSSNYNAVMGISTVSSDTPPEITAFTANNTSPMRLISSSLGDATLNLAGGGTATRVAELSGSTLDGILSASQPYTMGNSAEQYIIIAPSGSDMVGIPTSMTDSFGGSTAGEYVMAINADGGGFGAEPSEVHLLDTSGSINGYDKHFVIGRKGHNAAASIQLRVIASSGSLPS